MILRCDVHAKRRRFWAKLAHAGAEILASSLRFSRAAFSIDATGVPWPHRVMASTSEAHVQHTLRGAWVKKFSGSRMPASVFMKVVLDAADPTIECGGMRVRINSVDGGLFDDAFQFDRYFDKHRDEEARCFSLRECSFRMLYLIAASDVEKAHWVDGIRILIDEWPQRHSTNRATNQRPSALMLPVVSPRCFGRRTTGGDRSA